jgi:fructuronate reductase
MTSRPERIVHIGLGAFFRAHQAWYTEHASDAEDWGIVAYTGRSPKMAEELSSQNCEYTLITRGPSGDSFERIASIVRAEAGTNLANLIATVSRPETAIVTLTITEAGYRVDPTLELTETALGRLCLALEARRKVNGQPLTLISCDNMPNNAAELRSALAELAKQLAPGLQPAFANYLDQLSFVATSVDRITPATTADELELVAAAGITDASPVVTESFSDWVLEGEFVLGSPDWQSAGARVVADLEPFENRKLWLLNGAHTIAATLGQVLGHQTVDSAIADDRVLTAVESWWQDATEQLISSAPEVDLDLENYQQALLERFRNPRIQHQLAQIAKDSLTKLSVRVAPVAVAQLRAGRQPLGAATAFAAYLAYLGSGFEIIDTRKAELDAVLERCEDADVAHAIVDLVSPELAQDREFMNLVSSIAATLASGEKAEKDNFGNRLPKVNIS